MFNSRHLLENYVVSSKKIKNTQQNLNTGKTEHDEYIDDSINTIPWIEKYRPKKLKDVICQEEIVKMLSTTIKSGELPHLLLHGSAGVGKTSTVLALVKELFGPRIYNDRVLELNASDERGINVVRNKIITFAKTAIGAKDPKYPCPPYKIIILDEADAMTSEAQSALRKTIEDYSTITRFCFICNYINQIIDPIMSRCVKFRFKPLDSKNIIKKLEYVALKENMNLNKSSFKAISSVSNGDMRKAIMLLQNLKYISTNNLSTSTQITKEDVYKTANCITPNHLKQIQKVCIDDKTESTDKIMKLTKHIKNLSYPVSSILNNIHHLVINDNTVSDKAKSLISIYMSNAEKRLIDGADEYLQLLSVFIYIKSTVIKI